jgi:hypothetical protein
LRERNAETDNQRRRNAEKQFDFSQVQFPFSAGGPLRNKTNKYGTT